MRRKGGDEASDGGECEREGHIPMAFGTVHTHRDKRVRAYQRPIVEKGEDRTPMHGEEMVCNMRMDVHKGIRWSRDHTAFHPTFRTSNTQWGLGRSTPRESCLKHVKSAVFVKSVATSLANMARLRKKIVLANKKNNMNF